MAYDFNGLLAASDAFIRDVTEQLGMSDEQARRATDISDDVASDLLVCQNQSEVNETLTARFGEMLNHDPEAYAVMAGTIDYFWHIYGDAVGEEIEPE